MIMHDLCNLSYHNFLSQTMINFFRFPSKHLGRIIHGLRFLWVNVSSIRCVRCYHTFLSFILNALLKFLSPGASACVHLNQFEEAIMWCDKGLAVSFYSI